MCALILWVACLSRDFVVPINRARCSVLRVSLGVSLGGGAVVGWCVRDSPDAVVIGFAWESVGAGEVVSAGDSLWGSVAASVLPGGCWAVAVDSTSPGDSLAVSLTLAVVVVVSPAVAASWVVSVSDTAVLSLSVGKTVAATGLVGVASAWSLEAITVLVKDVVSGWGEVLVAVADSPSVLQAVSVVAVGSADVAVAVWGGWVMVSIMEVVDQSVAHGGATKVGLGNLLDRWGTISVVSVLS